MKVVEDPYYGIGGTAIWILSEKYGDRVINNQGARWLWYMCIWEESFTILLTQQSKESLRETPTYHADLCRLMQTDSLEGSKYFLLVMDDHSRMCWVYFIKLKSKSFDCFRRFQALIKRQMWLKIRTLRTNRGGKFMSSEFKEHHGRLWIKREHMDPYMP